MGRSVGGLVGRRRGRNGFGGSGMSGGRGLWFEGG